MTVTVSVLESPNVTFPFNVESPPTVKLLPNVASPPTVKLLPNVASPPKNNLSLKETSPFTNKRLFIEISSEKSTFAVTPPAIAEEAIEPSLNVTLLKLKEISP